MIQIKEKQELKDLQEKIQEMGAKQIGSDVLTVMTTYIDDQMVL